MPTSYTVLWNPDPANGRRTPPPLISPCMFLIGFVQISESIPAPVKGGVATFAPPRGDADAVRHALRPMGWGQNTLQFGGPLTHARTF